jgi:hypothetical protein
MKTHLMRVVGYTTFQIVQFVVLYSYVGIIEIYNWRHYYIQYIRMFAHCPQVPPSFYKTEKGGEEVQTVVTLPATAFYYTKLLALVEAQEEQQLILYIQDPVHLYISMAGMNDIPQSPIFRAVLWMRLRYGSVRKVVLFYV